VVPAVLILAILPYCSYYLFFVIHRVQQNRTIISNKEQGLLVENYSDNTISAIAGIEGIVFYIIQIYMVRFGYVP